MNTTGTAATRYGTARGFAERMATVVPGEGQFAVIVLASRLDKPGKAVVAAASDAEHSELECLVVALTVPQAKAGVRHVLIGDPAGMLAESPCGLNDLYLALTRPCSAHMRTSRAAEVEVGA